jgi:hypothetical protein
VGIVTVSAIGASPEVVKQTRLPGHYTIAQEIECLHYRYDLEVAEREHGERIDREVKVLARAV